MIHQIISFLSILLLLLYTVVIISFQHLFLKFVEWGSCIQSYFVKQKLDLFCYIKLCVVKDIGPMVPFFPLLCSVKNRMRNISLSWFFWVRWYFNSENPRISFFFVRLNHDDIHFVSILDLLQLIRNPNCDCCIKLNYLLYSISSKILVKICKDL